MPFGVGNLSGAGHQPTATSRPLYHSEYLAAAVAERKRKEKENEAKLRTVLKEAAAKEKAGRADYAQKTQAGFRDVTDSVMSNKGYQSLLDRGRGLDSTVANVPGQEGSARPGQSIENIPGTEGAVPSGYNVPGTDTPAQWVNPTDETKPISARPRQSLGSLREIDNADGSKTQQELTKTGWRNVGSTPAGESDVKADIWRRFKLGRENVTHQELLQINQAPTEVQVFDKMAKLHGFNAYNAIDETKGDRVAVAAAGAWELMTTRNIPMSEALSISKQSTDMQYKALEGIPHANTGYFNNIEETTERIIDALESGADPKVLWDVLVHEKGWSSDDVNEHFGKVLGEAPAATVKPTSGAGEVELKAGDTATNDQGQNVTFDGKSWQPAEVIRTKAPGDQSGITERDRVERLKEGWRAKKKSRKALASMDARIEKMRSAIAKAPSGSKRTAKLQKTLQRLLTERDQIQKG